MNPFLLTTTGFPPESILRLCLSALWCQVGVFRPWFYTMEACKSGLSCCSVELPPDVVTTNELLTDCPLDLFLLARFPPSGSQLLATKFQGLEVPGCCDVFCCFSLRDVLRSLYLFIRSPVAIGVAPSKLPFEDPLVICCFCSDMLFSSEGCPATWGWTMGCYAEIALVLRVECCYWACIGYCYCI